MARTAIEWTEASWNPIVGCSVVSIGDQQFARLGKKAAGRLLDGVEHNAMPERAR